MILKPNGRAKQRLTISGVQMAAILGFENLTKATGLVLVCQNCLSEGDPFLQTDNDPLSREWKIDCQCKERRIATMDAPNAMDATGDLMAQLPQIVQSLGLVVRCPERKCVNHALEIERTEKNTIVRCRCAKTTLRPPSQIHH